MGFHMSSVRKLHITLLLLAACAGNGSSEATLELSYHEGSRTLRVRTDRGLSATESLHVQLRRGGVGALDCRTMADGIPRIDGDVITDGLFQGPAVPAEAFETPYDARWLEVDEPTPEMLAAIAEGGWIVDVCFMDGTQVVRELEVDVTRTTDSHGGDGKFDGDDEERITSVGAYAEACVSEMGEIPFFEPLAEHDYGTANCLDGTPIPMVITAEDGSSYEMPTTRDESRGRTTSGYFSYDECDDNQFIYSSCEPNAATGVSNGPRVQSSRNDQGTHWVLLCRKAQEEEGRYYDIAMIGHNPYTGKTCFFQNGLGRLMDGLHVPHPGDTVESEQSPQQWESLWSGLHGGIGSGIECAECHDADPFIHTPWIDGARDESGDTVVPRMGENDDFFLGFNDAPYSIVNLRGQGWTMPNQIVSEEAAPCTRCHRMGGDGRWANSWLRRLEGEDSAWNRITTAHGEEFDNMFWMPPDAQGLDREAWAESEYGQAIDFIQRCASNPSAEGCEFAEIPSEPITDPGELPTIELEGMELALEAAKIVGARVFDAEDERCTGEGGLCATRRCAECHSVSRNGLEHWLELTDHAWGECNLETAPEDMTQEEALAAVNCMREEPSDPQSVFEAAKIGILATGAQYGTFRELFQRAFSAEEWLVEWLRFKARVGMPKGNHPALSQREFATLLKWFQADLANATDVIDDPPAPTTCEDYLAPAMADHIDEMQYEGWQAINEENGIRMFACDGTETATECFKDGRFPLRGEWVGEVGNLHQVRDLGFRTSFWMRSSADGRFVGNGGRTVEGFGSTITDLLRDVNIGIKASYDPGFFPDNSGFIFQGGGQGAGLCAQSLLETADTVDFTDASCMRATGVNLYQHVARGVGGGDYFIINSQFTSDSGNASDSNPRANWGVSATMKFTPMIFNGATYEQQDAVVVDSPYEGDSVLSPSSRLVISRLAGGLGYQIRRVQATQFGADYVINVDEVMATVCMDGAKANISYDERFFVTHVYAEGKADIWLVDLTDGSRHRVTNMPEGTQALFPHFRNDGWFYFLVKDGDERYAVASDAALRIAAGE